MEFQNENPVATLIGYTKVVVSNCCLVRQKYMITNIGLCNACYLTLKTLRPIEVNRKYIKRFHQQTIKLLSI